MWRLKVIGGDSDMRAVEREMQVTFPVDCPGVKRAGMLNEKGIGSGRSPSLLELSHGSALLSGTTARMVSRGRDYLSGNLLGERIRGMSGLLPRNGPGTVYNTFNVTIDTASITTNDVTLTPQATNPGGANTLWIDNTLGHLHHGIHDMENYDTTQLYTSPNGDTLAGGATGAINNPVSTITEALSLRAALGTTINLDGDYTGEAFTLPAQTVIRGDSFLSFRSLLGNVTASGSSWTGVPPFGFNQSEICDCSIQGLVDYQAIPMVSPLLLISNSALVGGAQTNDSNCDALLVLKDCIVASLVDVVNTNFYSLNTTYGFVGMTPGSLQISHSAPDDMTVYVSNEATQPGGTVAIAANSVANILTVYLIGNAEFSAVNVNSVTSPGGLVLVLDDVPNINWGVGAQANTTVQLVKRADRVGYFPANPGDWPVVPANVTDALDTLATGGAGDVTGPAVATDNAISRYDGTTGKLIQNSLVTLSDTGDLASVATLNGSAIPATIGNVVGPATASNTGIARYNGTSGKLIQDSPVTIDGNGTFSHLGSSILRYNTASGLFAGPAAGGAAATATRITAIGSGAGQSLTAAGGDSCTLVGGIAGTAVTTATDDTLIGAGVCQTMTTGSFNTIVGSRAYAVGNGDSNTAMGYSALANRTTGSLNIGIGRTSGSLSPVGVSSCIHIGSGGSASDVTGTTRIGDSATATATFIQGIYGATTVGAAIPVLVDANGQLGTISSSARFKENVTTITSAESSKIHLMRFVDFNYIGQTRPQRGLIAEEVGLVDDSACVYDDAERTFLRTVDYQQILILVAAEVQQQKKTIDVLSARITDLEKR